jgi:hypothetical protein
MTEIDPDDERIAARAHLLPEELAAGSDSPEAEAKAILEDSDARTAAAERAGRASNPTPDR